MNYSIYKTIRYTLYIRCTKIRLRFKYILERELTVTDSIVWVNKYSTWSSVDDDNQVYD